MMKNKVFLVLLVLAVLMAWIPSRLATGALARPDREQAAASVLLTDEQREYPLGLHLEILEDPEGTLTIDQAASSEMDAHFVPSQAEVPNFGYTSSVYWVRFHLDSQASLTSEWLLSIGFANIHLVDLYTPLQDGEGYSVKQTGTLRPISTRDIFYPLIVFSLNVPPQTQPTYYLRIQSSASMTLPLTLWGTDAFLARTQREQSFHWLFFGAILALLTYHLILPVFLREPGYLYFTTFLASLLIHSAYMDGYLGLYILPSLNIAPNVLPLAFGCMFLSMFLFSGVFLELKNHNRKLSRMNNIFIASWVFLLCLVPFLQYRTITPTMIIWSVVSLVAISITSVAAYLKKANRLSRFFLIAWLGMGAGLFVTILVRLTILPSTAFTENSYHLGYLWVAVCWSISLVSRINQLKSETASAYQALKNNELRLEQILEGMPLGVILYGKDQKPMYSNRRVSEIVNDPDRSVFADLARSRTLDIAIEDFALKIAGSEDRYPLETMPVYQALQGIPAAVDDIELVRKDQVVSLEVLANPIRDQAGSVESAVLVVQDITNRKRAEAELAEHHKHLEELVVKRTFELRTFISWLNTINEIHQTLGGRKDIPQAYHNLSETARQLFDAEAVFILHWEANAEFFEINWANQPDPLSCQEQTDRVKTAFHAESDLVAEIAMGKTVLLTADPEASYAVALADCVQKEALRAFLFTPLIARQAVSGLLGFAFARPVDEISQAQVFLGEKIALDIANLTQNALLLDQAVDLAMAEERNRIARELHDSVTQLLFSASLMAEVLPQRLRRDPEAALETAADLRRMTRGALAEMRTLLLELRPAGITAKPLKDLLAQLAEAITSRIDVAYQITITEIPPIPPEVHTAFYRVAQEALNNIVKHSGAKEIVIRLLARPEFDPYQQEDWRGELELYISDDGVGFGSDHRNQTHFGLEIMRERAAGIGAEIKIASQTGEGTEVCLTWIARD